jgi:hypothetical protein
MRDFNVDDEQFEQHDMLPPERLWRSGQWDEARWCRFNSIERLLLIEQGWITAEVDAGYALMVRE